MGSGWDAVVERCMWMAGGFLVSIFFIFLVRLCRLVYSRVLWRLFGWAWVSCSLCPGTMS